MTIAHDIIKAKIGGDLPAEDLDLVAGLIEDRIVEVDSLAAIDAAIEAGRREFAPLFHPVPPPAPAATLTGCRPPRSTAQKDAARLAAALASGNPFAEGPSRNHTFAALVDHLAPDQAAKLRRAAGI